MSEAKILLVDYPMVETLANTMLEDRDLTVEQVIETIHQDFDRAGPYHFAKREGLLVNGSGEEFAVQFMGFYNTFTGRSVY